MPVAAHDFRAALTANSTATSFTAQIPTATEPSGDGVIVSPRSTEKIPKYLQLVPFGTNGDNDTFDMRLWGYTKVAGSALYIPQLILDLSVTLGNISGAAIAANTFMADTIVINEGDDNAADISTADDTTASILVHTRGCQYFKFDWDLAGGQEAASMNCYYRFVDQD